MQVFVSNHLIPEDFSFNTAHEPCYMTADGEQKIVPGSEVRLRIVGTRVDAHEIVSTRCAALGLALGLDLGWAGLAGERQARAGECDP